MIWERGRLVRNEREARTVLETGVAIWVSEYLESVLTLHVSPD
jgi:hypothetical protein